LIQRVSQDELADIIYQLGEERRSRRVARCVKQAAERGELETTLDLRRAVVRAVGPHRIGGADPATRTFQALRIAVNGELEQLESALAFAPRILKPGGKVVVLELMPHEETWVRERLGHRHLGFEPEALSADLKEAGFSEVTCETHARDAAPARGGPFRVFLLTGVKR
jgi:16S rRNA (cytosine1402-N4)-methyltransferase